MVSQALIADLNARGVWEAQATFVLLTNARSYSSDLPGICVSLSFS